VSGPRGWSQPGHSVALNVTMAHLGTKCLLFLRTADHFSRCQRLTLYRQKSRIDSTA